MHTICTQNAHTQHREHNINNSAQPQHRTTHLYAQLFTYIVFMMKQIYQKTL